MGECASMIHVISCNIYIYIYIYILIYKLMHPIHHPNIILQLK